MLTPPVHMENAGRFADVITTLDDHTITVEKKKQEWAGNRAEQAGKII